MSWDDIMNEVKLGEKGQVTLPKVFRDLYGLTKGDQLGIIDLGNGIIEIVVLKHSKELAPPVIKTNLSASVEDMDEAIKDAVIDKIKKGSVR